jgi:hypothetical protein
VKSSLAQLRESENLQCTIQTLAMLAARKGHASILDLYLKKGPTVDEAVHVSAGLDVGQLPGRSASSQR